MKKLFIGILVCLSISLAVVGGVFISRYENLLYEYNNQDYVQTIKVLTEECDKLKSEKAQLEVQVQTLTETSSSQKALLDETQKTVESLRSEKASLEEQNAANLQTIEKINGQIQQLNSQIEELQEQHSYDTNQVQTLKGQVTNLQALNSQLQKTNELNLQTIASLTSQITTLNEQITSMSSQVQEHSSVVAGLNTRISELQKTIEYYEQYIAGQEVDGQVVVSFEFNGSIINVQIIAKNSYASLVDPQSTDYVTFNYWTVDGEKVTLSEYPVTKNTKFVANVTRKYDVKYSVDGRVENSYIIEENAHPTVPSTPQKDGYVFKGWTLNGVDIVDVNSYEVKESTTFIAKFAKVHTVTFMYEQEIKSTQQIENGNRPTNVEVESTDKKIFNGWTLNGVKVNVEEQEIFADTTFVADISYKYEVKFMVDDQQYGQTQLVLQNGFAQVPDKPIKEDYIFEYWTLNNEEKVEVSTYQIIQDTIFIAKFKEATAFADVSWKRVSQISDDIANNNMNSQQVEEKYGWKIGDEKTFQMTTGEEVTMQILGFNHDDKSDGSGKAGITLGMKNCLATTYAMNSSATDVGGWDKSEMRTSTMATLFSQLPTDLQNVIKAVDKKAFLGYVNSWFEDMVISSADITTSSDKLWLCAYGEIVSSVAIQNIIDSTFNNYLYGYLDEGSQYEYYKNLIGDDTLESFWVNALSKKLSNGAGLDSIWWLRSIDHPDDGSFQCAGVTAHFGTSDANSVWGVSFCFCI